MPYITDMFGASVYVLGVPIKYTSIDFQYLDITH
jgi:hypothetical protein